MFIGTAKDEKIFQEFATSLSTRGLFIETPRQFPASTETKLHFLVQEGEINAQAVVCHMQPPTGLGLKFTSVREEHHRRLKPHRLTPSPQPFCLV